MLMKKNEILSPTKSGSKRENSIRKFSDHFAASGDSGER